MVNIFETREIIIDKRGFSKANLERVTDWRKGIAVARYRKRWATWPASCSIKPSWHYFLIDKGFNYLYKKLCLDEAEIEIEGEPIERVFGGYYIVRDVQLDGCRTFPGQDRDTEFYYSTCIKYVLDENGILLSEEEKKEYLKQNPIKHTTEYGDDFVECESSFYSLETYQLLFSMPKTLKLKPIGKFKDGRFRVGIVSDYRNFYIIVKDKTITTIYDENQFKFIEKILEIDKRKDIYLKDKYEASYDKPDETINIKEIQPEVTVKINNYLSIFSDLYEMNGSWELVFDENYGIERYKFQPETCYYYIDDEWRMIDGMAAQKVYNQLFELEVSRPNYIQDIETIADEFVLNREIFSIFRFECRPYGFITKDGKFDYDFDVNNIKW